MLFSAHTILGTEKEKPATNKPKKAAQNKSPKKPNKKPAPNKKVPKVSPKAGKGKPAKVAPVEESEYYDYDEDQAESSYYEEEEYEEEGENGDGERQSKEPSNEEYEYYSDEDIPPPTKVYKPMLKPAASKKNSSKKNPISQKHSSVTSHGRRTSPLGQKNVQKPREKPKKLDKSETKRPLSYNSSRTEKGRAYYK